MLAGDNALIIGLVARNLPRQTQRKVIFWGTFGAIAARALMAIVVVYILHLPGFMLAGAIALVWIARKLLTPDPAAGNHAAAVPAASFAIALRTIVVADAVMGIDNVLGIGGAATGSVLLIVLGLAISVPIIVWGSHLVIRLVDRFPSIILLGGAVLAWTAYSMIVREPLLISWFADSTVIAWSMTCSWYALRCSIQPFLISLITQRGSRSTQKQMPPRNWHRCSTASRSRRGPDGPSIIQLEPLGKWLSGSVSDIIS